MNVISIECQCNDIVRKNDLKHQLRINTKINLQKILILSQFIKLMKKIN